MHDPAHEETDALLEELERRIAREYERAARETQEKLDDYLRRFATKDRIWQRWVAAGEKTAEEYKQWRIGQIAIGQRWEEMRETLAQDYHNANEIVRSVARGYMPQVYALNHNYGTFEVERGSRIDTSYTLYSRETVERILRENPDLLPPPGRRMKAKLAAGKDIAWQEGQIQSVTLQAILQGESIPNMSRRIAREMGETNHKSTIRYARTAITGAQNAGRVDAYRRAEAMGIKMQREWRATLDMRTRYDHRQLDGQVRSGDDPFEVGGYTIRYPGDPDAPAHSIWNCRCTLRGLVSGLEPQARKYRSDAKLEGMSYNEWRDSHVEKPEPITRAEDRERAARRAYIRQYGGHGDGTPLGGM